MKKDFPLPIPTGATKEGPRLSAKSATLELRYDFEQNDGSVEWVTVHFAEVLAYRFQQSICADLFLDANAHNMSEFSTSNWLSTILDRWDQAVGWQEYQISLAGSSRFKHYVINFDDVGVLEVICSNFHLSR